MSKASSQINYADTNTLKTSFEEAYNRLDPRLYFSKLGALDYAIPERAAPIFHRLFNEYASMRGKEKLSILDIGCSYGINAAVLKYGCNMDDLRAHYEWLDAQGVAPHQVLNEDRKMFGKRDQDRELSIIGLDKAQFAAAYAFWAGLLADAIPEDLETQEPSSHAAEMIARCDLVISTGCVGYVTDRTFERILECQPANDRPWIASFVLRMFDYGPISRMLERYGYVTERLDGRLFLQRRFADSQEREGVLSALEARGLSTEGLEDEGHYLAGFYLSRPAADARAQSLKAIFRRSE